jgi:hypothetical protein
MDTFIVGNRASSDNWMAAQQLPVDQLPPLAPEDEAEAGRSGRPLEQFARSQYATALTDRDLEEKIKRIARPVRAWMSAQSIDGTITRVSLNTLRGRIRFDVRLASGVTSFEIDETLVDDILLRGSKESVEGLARLLAFNLGEFNLAAVS